MRLIDADDIEAKPIDADKMKEQISVAINSVIECDETEEELNRLRSLKVTFVETEPMRNGRWIKDRDGFHHCSECGENTDRKEDSFGYEIGEFKNPYCGQCGAKMKMEEKKMCECHELAEPEQGIGNECPFTGEPCWDDMECSECAVEKAYMSYMESKSKEEGK